MDQYNRDYRNDNELDKRRFSIKRTAISLAVGIAIALVILGIFVNVTAIITEGMVQPAFGDYLTTAILFGLLIGVLLLIPANNPLRGLKNTGRVIGVIALPFLLLLTLGLWEAQNYFLYPKTETDTKSSEDIAAISGMQKVELQDGADTIYGWYWNQTGRRAPLIVFFGGNAEDSLSMYRFLADREGKALFEGYQVLTVDYPGYADSDGTANAESIYRLSRLVWDYANQLQSVDRDHIVLMGWSLGTGVVTRLAADVQPAGLVLLSPFFNGAEMVNSFAKDALELPFTVPSIFVNNPYQNDAYANKITTKTLVVAVKDDRMIPYEQSERLSRYFLDAEFLPIEEGGHGASFRSEEANDAIRAYLQEVTK